MLSISTGCAIKVVFCFLLFYALFDHNILGINTRCIALTSTENPSQPKSIKLCKASYITSLSDLHRSNSFGPNTPPLPEEPSQNNLTDGWLSRDMNESSLNYTKQRDIHDVAIVLLQMLLGLDVCERYADPGGAISDCMFFFCCNSAGC